MPGKLRRPGVLAAVAACSVLAGACRQDMHDNPRYEPLEYSAFFGDARASRTPVPGTVARGMLREDDHLYAGKVGGQLTNVFPMPVTTEVVERGRERFDVFCSPCHGRTGEGDGMVVQRGFPPPPSLLAPRLEALEARYIVDVIGHGHGVMFGYGDRVEPRDRWAIVAYVRALQLAAAGTAAR